MVLVFNMEGEREMKIPELTPPQLKIIGIAFIVLIVAGLLAWLFILPAEWVWILYIPAIFAVLVFGLTGIAILIKPSLVSQVECVYVNHKRVSCCQFCPMAEVKDNIVNNKFPVVKCRETAKICYQPMKIPRWCPYAKN